MNISMSMSMMGRSAIATHLLDNYATIIKQAYKDKETSMAVQTQQLPAVGQKINGFEVKAVTPLKHLQMVAYQMEHLKTGAKVLHLHTTEDAENLFSVSFPTAPPDNSGLPHILEHSVLAGSQKYPVREPFFEMLKMSPATFINAMTGPDCTYYPVSSKVKQDLFNLAEVYFDAVFHPLLTENTFKREGHHLAPIEQDDPTGELKITGVVYNEMCGALSDPEQRLETISNQKLFPDTIYGLEYGGDPKYIPELTYEAFRQFHADRYHPSNARFVFYGNIPTEEYLGFLAPKLEVFDRRDLDLPVTRQPRWQQPQSVMDSYPIGASEPEKEKTYILMKWLVGDATDAAEWTDLDILNRILLGNEGAPLKKAIVDSQLGQDLLPHSGMDSVGCEAVFAVGLQGSESDRVEAFEKLVAETLEKIAAAEIDREIVEAAFQQAGYQHQEVARMYPVRMLFRVMQSWNYDGDPLTFLNMSDRLAECKQRYAENPNYFNSLIREKLLNNPHRLTAVLRPDREWQTIEDKALALKMEQLRSQLNEAELQRIAKEAAELDADAGTPNPPEAIAKLPQLKVTDLPPKPEHIPTIIEELPGGAVVLRNQIFANGVSYLHLDFNLQGLPPELWPYIPAYIDALQKLGAAGMNYEKIARRIAASTGGLNFQCQLQTHAEDARRPVYGFRVTLKTLDDRIEPALALLEDVLFKVDPRDTARLRDVMLQSRAQYSSDLVYDGIHTAMQRAAGAVTPMGYLGEQMNGLPQLELVEKICSKFDELGGDLMAKIETIRDFVSSQPLTASFTGSDRAYSLVRNTLSQWSSKQQSPSIAQPPTGFTPIRNLRQGLAGPVQVAYCVQTLPAPHYSNPSSPLLRLGAHLLGLGYLFSEVRLKGNAYGAGCSYSSLGETITLYSYRDPHVVRTLKVFAGLVDYVKNADWSQEDVERAIIATTQKDSPVLRPELVTGLSLGRYLTGQNPEIRDDRYERAMKATVAEVKQAILDAFEKGGDRTAVCVMSSREKLQEANGQMSGNPLDIRDIL
jgi:Zn-dependent M16 (insulinase) family peptidase